MSPSGRVEALFNESAHPCKCVRTFVAPGPRLVTTHRTLREVAQPRPLRKLERCGARADAAARPLAEQKSTRPTTCATAVPTLSPMNSQSVPSHGPVPPSLAEQPRPRTLCRHLASDTASVAVVTIITATTTCPVKVAAVAAVVVVASAIVAAVSEHRAHATVQMCHVGRQEQSRLPACSARRLVLCDARVPYQRCWQAPKCRHHVTTTATAAVAIATAACHAAATAVGCEGAVEAGECCRR